MKPLCVAISLSLLGAIASAPMSCPSQEDIMPCTCKHVAVGLYVVCKNFNESSHLINAFKALRECKMQNVLLSKLYFTKVLPNDIFHGLQINELRVESSKLKFPEPAFKGLDESLHVLNVAQYSIIKGNEEFSLAKLSTLTELDIKSIRLEKVKNEWLNDKIPNVNTVTLDKDGINEVEDEAFQRLTQMKTISLSNNRIKKVARSMFPRPASSLTRMDLSFNEIGSLPFDIFFQMPSLNEVILSGNDLQTLPEMTWSPIWDNLISLMLIENRLTCDDKLDWMKKVKRPFKLEGNCVAPKSMEGKDLAEILSK